MLGSPKMTRACRDLAHELDLNQAIAVLFHLAVRQFVRHSASLGHADLSQFLRRRQAISRSSIHEEQRLVAAVGSGWVG